MHKILLTERKNRFMKISLENVICKQLHNADILSAVQLEQLAGLIYDTDYLIYPAMFNSRDEALRVLSEALKKEDAMFCLDNCYVAMYNKVFVGLILWHRGPLLWDRDKYYSCLKELDVSSTELLDQVASDYLESYSDIREDTVALINVCTDEGYRGNGIGGKLLHDFINSFGEPYIFDLHVLAENPPALAIYGREGFFVVDTDQAYLSNDENELCHHMMKTR